MVEAAFAGLELVAGDLEAGLLWRQQLADAGPLVVHERTAVAELDRELLAQLVRPDCHLHAAVLGADVVERDPARDRRRGGERPVRIVLVPGKLAADDWLLDTAPSSIRTTSSEPSSWRAMPAMTGLETISQKRSSRSQRLNRKGTECGFLSTSVFSATALAVPEPTVAVPVVGVDDRIGELVRLRLAPALEVVVERLARPRDLLVVEDADREEETLVVVPRDLLGSQWICADLRHLRSFSPSRGAGRSPPAPCSLPRRRPTGSRGPRPEVPVIRCGVLRGMKQMSPGAEIEASVADDLRAAAADDHHHLLRVRVVVVLVRRPVRIRRLAERDQRRPVSAGRPPSVRRDARTAPPASCEALCPRAARRPPPVRGRDVLRETRSRPPRPPPGASRGSVCPTAGSSTTRASPRRSASCRPCSGSVRSSLPPTSTSAGWLMSPSRSARFSAPAIARHWRT